MDGQLLQEAEKEREGLPASPAFSDIRVFSALDHRYEWSAAVGGGEREGGYTRKPCPLTHQRLLCSRPQVWMVSCCRSLRREGIPASPPTQTSVSSLLHRIKKCPVFQAGQPLGDLPLEEHGHQCEYPQLQRRQLVQVRDEGS